jgi:hypothetical protein
MNKRLAIARLDIAAAVPPTTAAPTAGANPSSVGEQAIP